MKKRILSLCKSCRSGSCCCDGVSADLKKAMEISLVDLDIKKPWFENIHRDDDFSSGWAVATVVRNGRCVFQRKDNLCSIYPIRPRYCREFPYEDGELAQMYEDLCPELNFCPRKKVKSKKK